MQGDITENGDCPKRDIGGCLKKKKYTKKFKNSNAFFKSSGVSMQILSSISVSTVFILNPFSIQRNCSSDSAFSRRERESFVIFSRTSARYAYKPTWR